MGRLTEQLSTPYGRLSLEREPRKPGFLEGVKEDIQKRAENVERISDITKIPGISPAGRTQGFASGVLQTAGEAAGGVLDIAGRGISAVIPDVIEDPILRAVGAVIQTKEVQDVASRYSEFKKTHPEATENLEAGLNLLMVLGIPKAKVVTGGVIKETAKPIGALGEKIEAGATAKITRDREAFARRLTRPVETKAVKEAEVARTTEARVGPFRRSVVAPTTSELAAQKAVLEVPGVSGNKTIQQNWNLINAYNRELARTLERDLARNDIIFPKRELIARLNAEAVDLARSPALVGDEAKVAKRLIDELVRRIEIAPAKGSALLRVRKDYDIWVKAQKGPKIFMEGKRENAFTLANDRLRRTVNDFLEEKTPSTKVKESLRKQTALYKALENIRPKAALEANNSVARAFQRMMLAIGIKNKLVQQIAAIVGIGGLGAAATFAPAAAVLGVGGFVIYQGGKLILNPKIRLLLGKMLKEYAKIAGNKSAQEVAGQINKVLEERGVSVGLSIKDISRGVYMGEKDLTTKFLDYAKGKTTLSKQEILDFARRPELKQGEANLLNRLGQEVREAKVSAQEFAQDIRQNLLELKPVKVKEPQYHHTSLKSKRKYEDMGDFQKETGYEEVVFESPITTNGSSHFPNSKNYFAHARGDEVVEGGKKIWREQEIQSDILQKEGLEQARIRAGETVEAPTKLPNETFEQFRDRIKNLRKQTGESLDLDKLQPFTNDRFGERIMRERIREKAGQGYNKYRLPTGETIGKIEGFQQNTWRIDSTGKIVRSIDDLKVGQQVTDANASQEWIITDILGEGRFKAVPKKDADFMLETIKGTVPSRKNWGLEKLEGYETPLKETFDLTGKSNPQYRRYENWSKFLKNKYGGKNVTDPQGNSWMEIDIPKGLAKAPVEAFGVGALGFTALGSGKPKDQ